MVQLSESGGKRPVFPVTVKAIVPLGGKLLLLRRHSGKWDLPGGKLAADEDIEDCLIRECREEVGFAPRPERLVAVRVRRRKSKPDPLVCFFLCRPEAASRAVSLSGEHLAWGSFAGTEIAALKMPAVYRGVLNELFAAGAAPFQ